MENATKALLIAAAVLVAIIIISLTLGVVRQGQETISSADMTQAEMDAVNAKFTMYEGTSVSTAQVNALLNTVRVFNNDINLQNKRLPIVVYLDGKGWDIGVNVKTEKLSGSSRYTVKCEFIQGLVRIIRVTTNP